MFLPLPMFLPVHGPTLARHLGVTSTLPMMTRIGRNDAHRSGRAASLAAIMRAKVLTTSSAVWSTAGSGLNGT